jgi:hypothetical protein
MYKVLNKEWKMIIVEKIDITKHKHLSWREFNENDLCIEKQEEKKKITRTRKK